MQDAIDRFAGPLGGIAGIFIAVTYLYALLLAIKLWRRHPTTLSITLLGFPGSGKTVFITTVFDELQQGHSGRIRLSPYGSDTVEEVARNLNSLARGVWLPRTKPGTVFFFRAIAAIRGSGARVKIEIGDFAGEDIAELQPTSDRWLHKTEYFKYVMDADVVLLVIDSEKFGPQPNGSTEEVINAFVAAIQILADHRGAVGANRLNVPVALLVTKADLLEDEATEFVKGQLERLIAVCQARCRYFNVFFVSSTGPLRDGKPPPIRKPTSVVEPLEWALGCATRFSFVDSLRSRVTSSRRTEKQRWDSFK